MGALAVSRTGVHDEDTADGDGLISEYFNDLHAYSLDAGKWHELGVTAPIASSESNRL